MKISGIDRDRVVPFRVDGFETDDYLAEFIKKAKQSDFFFNSDFEINWENNEWDLSRFIIKRNNLKTKIKFTDFDGEWSHGLDAGSESGHRPTSRTTYSDQHGVSSLLFEHS